MPFYQGKTEFSDTYLGDPQKWTTKITKKSVENDIVMSVRAPVGPVNIVSNDICIGRGLAAIRCSNKINFKFLFYVLKQMENRIQGNKGAAFASINKKDIEQIVIPLPPLSVQKKVVEEIESFQKIIDGAKQVVQNYKPIIKIDSNWETKYLPDICNNLDNKRIPITSSNRETGDIPYYDASGVVDYVKDYIFNEKLLLISEDGANLVARVTPIAFSIEGKSWVNNHAHVLQFNDYMLQKYVELYINQLDISVYVTGAAQPKLNQENLNRIEIKIPSSKTLKQIVTEITEELLIVQNNKKLISIFEKKIADRINEVWEG